MILKAEGISKRFLRNTSTSNFFYAVNKTDITLSAGKLTAVIGKSGSGKSTFLSMLAGILVPTEGKVFYDDKDIYALKDKDLSKLRNKEVGIIPQGQAYLPSLTVLENVMLPCRMYASKGEEEKTRQKALELLESLDIATLANVYPSELSGGECRRLSIARAFIRETGIILADEPTADLDEENTEIVLKALRSAADKNKTVLLVTHEKDALTYADDIYNMKSGTLSKQ